MMSIIFKTSFRMPLFRSSSKLVWISASAGMSAPVMRHISTVKFRVGGSHNSVAEGNCVAVRRGGEQPEANCWSVGGRTRFGGGAATSLLMHGEVRKSLDTLAWWEKRCPGSPRGWRRNDRKVWRSKRGDLYGR